MPSVRKSSALSTSAVLFVGLFLLLADSLLAQDTTVAFPEPLVYQFPVGSLIYKRATTGAIQSPGDTYSYTLPIDADQTVTLLVIPSKTLQVTALCENPSGNVIASGTAVSSGQQLILETIPASISGIYTCAVSGNDATTGDFSIQVILNAALDRRAVDDNVTIATALDLSSSAIAPEGCVAGCNRLAVNGSLSGNAHYYSFFLQAGEPVSLVVKFLSRISASLQLFDGNGNLVAIGTAGPQNVTASIQYVTPGSGTYYVQVGGSGSSDFNLVVTRSAGFELTPNGKSDPQALGVFNAIFGYVGSTNGPYSWYSFQVNAGDNLVVNTITPSDEGEQFHDNQLVPQIDLYDVNFNLVATNQNQPKNAPVVWTALETGTFFVSVSGAQRTTGEYVLQVQGNTGTL